MSYVGRINYGLMDRYLLTASLRYDGSSRLSEGNKWALFPSAAIAWRITEEDFAKNLDWLSNLKLRFIHIMEEVEFILLSEKKSAHFQMKRKE